MWLRNQSGRIKSEHNDLKKDSQISKDTFKDEINKENDKKDSNENLNVEKQNDLKSY